jgi:hypothetical protein
MAPSISIDKSASPTNVNEPGGSVTFTVTIRNDSVATDPVKVTSFTDTIAGGTPPGVTCKRADLSSFALATDQIAPSETITCTFVRTVSGDGPGTETDTVDVTAADDDPGGTNATDSDDATVTIHNLPPSVAITGAPASSPEGTAIDLGSTVNDPSPVDQAAGFTYAWSVTKNASPFASGSSASFTFTPDDNGTYVVTFSATDKDGGTGTTSVTIAVTNVAPTATLANGGPVNEGSPVSVTFSGASDPSTADTSAGFHYSFACTGGSAALAPTYAGSGTSATTTCTFDDNGSYTVYGRIFDKDNGSTTYSTTVTVNNVAPTATIVNTGPVAEGSPVGVRLTNPFDPSSADTAAGFHYSFACDGMTSSLIASYGLASIAAGTSCTFGDNGTYTVRGRILDKDGGYTDYQTSIVVTNVAPSLNTPVFTFNPFTGAATASIKYADPGWKDTHTATFNWGDGTSTTVSPDSNEDAAPDATGTFIATHAYDAIGCVANPPTVTVTDDDGGSTPYTFAISLDHYSVAFQAPIQDGARNIVKLGNVIPVKLQITNCAGQAVLGKTLSIGYIQGNVYDDADHDALVPPDSSSNADTTGVMRQVDSKYMYNLATKSLSTSFPFTVVVRDTVANQFVASFVIQTKK